MRDAPLFPNAEGRVCTKEAMVATIRAAAGTLDTQAQSTDGSRAVTGHSLRVSGAQGLTRKGVDLWVVQLLGRWGSSAVQRYVAEVPLEIAALQASEAQDDSRLEATVKRLVETALAAQRGSDEEAADTSVCTDGLSWVVNPWSGVNHRVRQDRRTPSTTTICGWNFAGIHGVILRPAGQGPRHWVLACGKCAPDRQA